MSDPLQASGQCRTFLHPLCPGGLCTCRCHQPDQPAGERLEGAAGTTEVVPAVAEAPGASERKLEPEPVDTTRWPGFFQQVAARRLARSLRDAVEAGHTTWSSTEPLAEEVGRIVVDQLLELAETLSEEHLLSGSVERVVDTARLIDPAYTEQHWDETKEARR